MTPDIDQIGKPIKQSGKKGPLGFAGSDEEVESREVRQVAIVEGRKGKVETPEGSKRITGQARLIRIPQGLVSIPGVDGAPISVDDINNLLNGVTKIRLASSLHKDRKRRTENLKGK